MSGWVESRVLLRQVKLQTLISHHLEPWSRQLGVQHTRDAGITRGSYLWDEELQSGRCCDIAWSVCSFPAAPFPRLSNGGPAARVLSARQVENGTLAFKLPGSGRGPSLPSGDRRPTRGRNPVAYLQDRNWR